MLRLPVGTAKQNCFWAIIWLNLNFKGFGVVQCLKSKTRLLQALYVRYLKYKYLQCAEDCANEEKNPLKQLFLSVRTAKLICKLISWISYSDPIGKKK